jgi:hypothetical protein
LDEVALRHVELVAEIDGNVIVGITFTDYISEAEKVWFGKFSSCGQHDSTHQLSQNLGTIRHDLQKIGKMALIAKSEANAAVI